MIHITKKLFLKRPHLTGEYDVVSYFDLPAKDLFDLRNLPPEELAYSFSHILKNVALYEYATRIDHALSKHSKEGLGYLARPDQTEIDFIVNALKDVFSPPSCAERAQMWYEHYFMPEVIRTLPLVADAKFAVEFEKVLLNIIRLKKRFAKLSKMKAKCFLSCKKKKRIEKLMDNIRYYLLDHSVGIYAILLYGFTLYCEKSSNVLMFRWYLKNEN